MEDAGVKQELDAALPVWTYAARHELLVDASPARALAAKHRAGGEGVPAG